MSELEIRKDYLGGESIATIYFGGGTPSLLQSGEIRSQLEKIYSIFDVEPDPEITIEVNPDDIDDRKLNEWRDAGVNRLSIGIQSFFEEDLKWMNRAHNAEQAIESLRLATQYFNNISMDLIYGTPSLTNESWKRNVQTSIALRIRHLSCYALTVEPKTPLYKMIAEHRTPNVDPDKQSEQFLLLMQWLEEAGYEHYEISNFAKAGYRSRHNSAYWTGKTYIGIGPSAHSYDGSSRQWNVSNNTTYIDSIQKRTIPYEKEILTPVQRLNEYIMTSLRTKEGLDLSRLETAVRHEVIAASEKYIERELMVKEGEHIRLTRAGKLLADGIASGLFLSEDSPAKIIS